VEHRGEAVEVRVAVEYGEAAVFGGRRGDEGVGARNAVMAVTACGEFAEGTHGGVRHCAIVAQDPQRVEFGLEREMLGARARE
jgi:hypothetical protein